LSTEGSINPRVSPKRQIPRRNRAGNSFQGAFMWRMTRILLAVIFCMGLMLLVAGAASASEGPHAGQLWLAWTPAERNIFVQGVIEGYWKGSQTACKLADDLFEVGKPHRLGQSPSGRCEARLEQFTKIKNTDSGPDLSAYTTVITEFYEKHPEYQNVPAGYLLFALGDPNYVTADHLYHMVLKGDLHPIRKD
jgi:hypothetical protein